MQNQTNMLNLLPAKTFAQYSCGAYGANAYDNSSCTTSTGTDTGGGLADTGYNILLPAALGLAVIIAGVILLVKRLRRVKSQS
jgi:hypothetical protein